MVAEVLAVSPLSVRGNVGAEGMNICRGVAKPGFSFSLNDSVFWQLFYFMQLKWLYVALVGFCRMSTDASKIDSLKNHPDSQTVFDLGPILTSHHHSLSLLQMKGS